jgi:hypothetical protein
MEFADYVNMGLELVKESESNEFQLWDLAADFKRVFNPTRGRPANDDDNPTFADLAGAWQVATNTVSEWASLGEYYPVKSRMYDDLSKSHYKLAKRYAGKDQGLAHTQLQAAVNNHLTTVASFRRFLDGIYWEGKLLPEQLPPLVASLLPEGKAFVWVVVSEYKDGEE